MTSKTWVLALITGLGGVAAAQPAPTPETSSGTGIIEPTPPTPPPTPPPVVTPPDTSKDSATERPVGLSFAIGLGYALPTALDMPNATSVRLRLASGLTLEPLVTLGKTTTTTDNGTTKVSTSTSEVQLAALVRLPMITRGRADFELVGAAALDSQKVDPDGDDNNTTTTTLGIGWGLAIGYWISSHWQLSLTATNPLISFTSQKRETGPGMMTENSSSTAGVIFDPRVDLMIHLYN